jgi:hypothetical protein
MDACPIRVQDPLHYGLSGRDVKGKYESVRGSDNGGKRSAFESERKKTEAILSFLNNYVVFKNSETNRKFMTKTDEIFEKKNTMGVIEQLAEIKRQEAIDEGKEESVRLFLANTEFSPAKIAELVKVPLTLVKKIKKSLSTK